jgi:hypothetical protein
LAIFPFRFPGHDPLADVVDDDPGDRIAAWWFAAKPSHCQFEGEHQDEDDRRKPRLYIV